MCKCKGNTSNAYEIKVRCNINLDVHFNFFVQKEWKNHQKYTFFTLVSQKKCRSCVQCFMFLTNSLQLQCVLCIQFSKKKLKRITIQITPRSLMVLYGWQYTLPLSRKVIVSGQNPFRYLYITDRTEGKGFKPLAMKLWTYIGKIMPTQLLSHPPETTQYWCFRNWMTNHLKM